MKRKNSLNNNSARAETIFITGICASGKSTLGKRLQEDLLKSGIDNLKLLDGEEIRKQFGERGETYGYSTDERNKVALKIAQMAAEYNREGVNCIISAICHMREIRKQMRSIIGNVMEIYLDCPIEICAQRDRKGHYAKAFLGEYDNFVGVTEPYQKSEHVELALDTARDTVEECARILYSSALTFLRQRIKQDKKIELCA